MKQTLDARGKACPIPVVETKKVLATLHEGDTVEVAVDNFIAVQNLSKMAAQKHFEVSSEKIDENHYLVTLTVTGTSNNEKVEKTVCIPDSRMDKTVVVFSSDKMGEGDEKLGRTLMKGFIYALTEQDQLPETILLYNNGAKLSVEGADSLVDLKLLESQGVEILTCGTCLNHYGLSEKLGVGSVTNMYVIVEKQMQATKIVKP
ncbi:sulfurtransferase-like selenium metabolism protein YedF [Pelosinus sp. IPA-1]|uniref:sulfurtransferase-like selenium metabolism protein YedF n=1 Tax=Pelosinus sp. IPA-1 TaxID=3029569 RepID=UPI002436266E|nr:sulfurtransferase-like selenium metabolism protein YedF [Pelosinus sp. IPA-1]GMB00474.1 selenium metabolism protein YedF [Pelosinus sp. IPA-1]